MRSFVWDYFEKQTSDVSRCNLAGCGKKLSYRKGNAPLIYHLKTKHNIIDQQTSLKRPAPESKRNPPKRQKVSPEPCSPPVKQEEADDQFFFYEDSDDEEEVPLIETTPSAQDENIRNIDSITELKMENFRLSNELIRLQIEKCKLEIASITAKVKCAKCVDL